MLIVHIEILVLYQCVNSQSPCVSAFKKKSDDDFHHENQQA